MKMFVWTGVEALRDWAAGTVIAVGENIEEALEAVRTNRWHNGLDESNKSAVVRLRAEPCEKPGDSDRDNDDLWRDGHSWVYDEIKEKAPNAVIECPAAFSVTGGA